MTLTDREIAILHLMPTCGFDENPAAEHDASCDLALCEAHGDWTMLQEMISGLPCLGTPKNSSAAVRAPQIKTDHLDIIGRLYEADFRLFGYE